MFSLNCKGRLLVADRPLVMGIINITPDSFYGGSRKEDSSSLIELAEKMISEGADIIDIGGQSTRPGSERISESEESSRVIPAIKLITEKFPSAFISVDTYRASVALQAVNAGASIVNDISAGNMNSTMINTVAALEVPYICMHMKGTPADMQQDPSYENITMEVLDFFINKTDECNKAGIRDVIIDPGFGFGKTIAHNFLLLKEMDAFRMLGKILMVGLSRKSTIYKSLGLTAGEALNGTSVLNTLALNSGAGILRVHDVKEAAEAVTLYMKYSGT
jgi:dihydropteroate synthase